MEQFRLDKTIGGNIYADEAKFRMPVVAKSGPASFNYADSLTNANFNNFAPGVREGIPLPTPFAQAIHRNNLWDGQQQRSFNWQDFGHMVTNPVARKRAEFWWSTLNDGNEQSMYPGIFQNTGTWNAAPTGFTALRFIHPFSTRAPVTTL